MGAERGFTLLEVLIALLIAALGLTALVQGSGLGLTSVQQAAQVQEAVSRARSRLAMIGHGVKLAPTRQQGDDGGGFSWQVRITPLATAAVVRQVSDVAPAPRLTLYGVEVVESWGAPAGRRRVRLETTRIGPAAP